jgi:hypothetical protein
LTRPTFAALCVSLGLALAAAGARAAPPDWEKVAAVRTIEIVTHDEDGSARETTIWLAVVDGQGFIRTGDTRWIANIRRNPSDVVLRIEGTEYPLRAEFIENEKLRERVTAAFHAKYGWKDTLVHWMRGSHPNIMHMISR